MKVAIGSDHGGYDLKKLLLEALVKDGHEVEDVGVDRMESVDYPLYAEKVCALVRSEDCERGILICGTGIGMSMVANRSRHIRAALCHDHYTARMSREHNNANVLCLGARAVGPGVAEEVVLTFMRTEFSGGRHQHRIEMFS